LGKDGSLGEEDTAKMVARIFKLKDINRQYRRWLNQAKQTDKQGILPHGLRFLTLLQHDPVVPKELLPPDWAGAAALELFDSKFRPQMGLIGDYLIDM
jgi:DNA-binding transcriptional regulator PaaX